MVILDKGDKFSVKLDIIVELFPLEWVVDYVVVEYLALFMDIDELF